MIQPDPTRSPPSRSSWLPRAIGPARRAGSLAPAVPIIGADAAPSEEGSMLARPLGLVGSILALRRHGVGRTPGSGATPLDRRVAPQPLEDHHESRPQAGELHRQNRCLGRRHQAGHRTVARPRRVEVGVHGDGSTARTTRSAATRMPMSSPASASTICPYELVGKKGGKVTITSRVSAFGRREDTYRCPDGGGRQGAEGDEHPCLRLSVGGDGARFGASRPGLRA